MHVLTATSRTQGQRANDYTFTIEGELVRVDEACGSDQRDPDGGCGCGRGFAGMSSCVRDLPMTATEFERAYVDSLVSAGWLRPEDVTDTEVMAEVRTEAGQLLQIAGWWPAGVVVERRLDVLQVRPELGEQRAS